MKPSPNEVMTSTLFQVKQTYKGTLEEDLAGFMETDIIAIFVIFWHNCQKSYHWYGY